MTHLSVHVDWFYGLSWVVASGLKFLPKLDLLLDFEQALQVDHLLIYFVDLYADVVLVLHFHFDCLWHGLYLYQQNNCGLAISVMWNIKYFDVILISLEKLPNDMSKTFSL